MAGMAERIYLDWNATTPLRPEAKAAMADAWEIGGNPSSVHAEGRQARRLVEDARAAVLRCRAVEQLQRNAERAGLPARLFPAFRAAVDTFHSMDFDGGLKDQERFQERMLQRFLTQPAAAAREDVDYLLDRMDRVANDARALARSA